MNCPVIELAQQLIARPSISPDDQGCQDLLIERLNNIGFTVEKCHLAIRLIFGLIAATQVKHLRLLDTQMLSLLAIIASGRRRHSRQPLSISIYMGVAPLI